MSSNQHTTVCAGVHAQCPPCFALSAGERSGTCTNGVNVLPLLQLHKLGFIPKSAAALLQRNTRVREHHHATALRRHAYTSARCPARRCGPVEEEEGGGGAPFSLNVPRPCPAFIAVSGWPVDASGALAGDHTVTVIDAVTRDVVQRLGEGARIGVNSRLGFASSRIARHCRAWAPELDLPLRERGYRPWCRRHQRQAALKHGCICCGVLTHDCMPIATVQSA
jgi:hypothetical protein